LAQTNVSLDYWYNIKAARYPAPEVCAVVVQLMLCSYAKILFDFKGTNSQQFYHFSSTPEASPTTSELFTNDAV
jgi:hypothetical protein